LSQTVVVVAQHTMDTTTALTVALEAVEQGTPLMSLENPVQVGKATLVELVAPLPQTAAAAAVLVLLAGTSQALLVVTAAMVQLG
jgi:hypothetical protein